MFKFLTIGGGKYNLCFCVKDHAQPSLRGKYNLRFFVKEHA